ncbi:hypothetical protein GCM10009634_19020 [Saccharothrix xinjiangensis]
MRGRHRFTVRVDQVRHPVGTNPAPNRLDQRGPLGIITSVPDQQDLVSTNQHHQPPARAPTTPLPLDLSRAGMNP